jgi:hypothetical protein
LAVAAVVQVQDKFGLLVEVGVLVVMLLALYQFLLVKVTQLLLAQGVLVQLD